MLLSLSSSGIALITFFTLIVCTDGTLLVARTLVTKCLLDSMVSAMVENDPAYTLIETVSLFHGAGGLLYKNSN